MSIRLDFNKGTVKQDVAAIPNKLLEGAEEAIIELAHLILGIAQVHVRVETGSLRDSGRIERGGQTMHWRQVRVRFGGYVVNPKTGKLVNYARIVEQKYPYLRPAVNEVKPQADALIRRICLEQVKQLESIT